MKTILLIAYHFPPLRGSSGIQRTLRFAQYLPEYGWRPIVLTTTVNAYEDHAANSQDTIPSHCRVIRAPALDTARHLAIAGRYPGFLARPDRWSSWHWPAVASAVRLHRREHIDAIWSTYPIATAHQIGASLARRIRIPWIADFRDPMAQDGYPADEKQWQAFKRIETEAATRAARLVFVTPSACELYRARYPQADSARFVVLENGFDEKLFEGLVPRSKDAMPLVLLHSGIVYPLERDPSALFEALGRLHAAGRLRADQLRIRFRAAVHDDLLRTLADRYNVHDLIEIVPAIPYREALQEMLDVDALLVLQGASCNEQIPAKVYEYLRAGRPVLGLTDFAGDTARTLSNMGVSFIAPLESVESIVDVLPRFIDALAARKIKTTSRSLVDQYSRRQLTGRLATLLDEVTNADSRRI